MSFRIDDILKNDSTHCENRHIEKSLERFEEQSCYSSSSANILLKALSNKPNYYHRSFSVPYAKTNFETNWYHSDNTNWFYSDNLCKNYFENYRNDGEFF